jgi:hypothetical protein
LNQRTFFRFCDGRFWGEVSRKGTKKDEFYPERWLLTPRLHDFA